MPGMRNRSISAKASRAAGFSLVEMMVAVTLGLIILAAILDSFSSHSSANNTNARFGEVLTNGRYAIDNLRRELQHAGYLGITFYDTRDNKKRPCADGPNSNGIQYSPCSVETADYGCGAGFATKIVEPIWGSNDAKGLPCIAAADYLAGDVLVLRRGDSVALPATPGYTFLATTLYIRSEFDKATVFVGAGSTAGPVINQPPAVDFKLKTDVFWVRPWTNSSSESPKVPALVRRSLIASGGAPAMSDNTTDVVIASGIENLQIQYGVADSIDSVRYYDAASTTNWQNVIAVRLWVLARSTDAEIGGFTNTSSFTMGDQTVSVNDSYQRQVFPLVVQLRR